MENKEKILVCGDVRGQFKYFFNRIDTLNKKSGPFELLLCVGDFFGENNDELIAYVNGFKHIPVPTYILGPTKESQMGNYENIKDGEICTNLTYLGKRGLYTVSSGLKIAYLSGLENNDLNNKNEFTFNKEDIVSVKNFCVVNKSTMGDYRGIDILMTTQWPKGVMMDNQENERNTSALISWLAMEIKPRYHFCGLNGIFYERPPYRLPAGSNTQLELATRFISLSHVNKDKDPKTKFIYALNLTPVDKSRITDLIQKTTDETLCPYIGLNFNQENSSLPQSDSQQSQYFYDMNSYGDGSRKRKTNNDKGNFKRNRPQQIDQEKCWFCLSSKDAEKHLIISIGDSFYLALAKGPVNEYHTLILSITHIGSTALLSKEEFNELEKFKNALKKFFESINKAVVFFERNYKSSHLQVNAIPVDKTIAWQIKHAFEDKSEEYSIEFEAIPNALEPTDLPEKGPFFAAELPDESSIIVKQMKHFPIQFGREVMCSENLLNCDDKTDWRQCLLERDDEIEMVKQFREKFSKFDFTV